jgi:hypothetical protein
MASQIQNLLEKTLGDGARSTNFEVFFNMGSDSILNDKNILIKSTALPTRSHQIIDFKYRGKSIPLRGQTKYSQTWECTFYITEMHDVRHAVEKIMDSLDNMNVYKSQILPLAPPIISNYNNEVYIIQKDHSDNETTMYTLHNVFPIEVGAITYDSSQVGVIAEMSVTFAYSYYEVIDVAAQKSGNAIDNFMKGITTKLNEFKPADLWKKTPDQEFDDIFDAGFAGMTPAYSFGVSNAEMESPDSFLLSAEEVETLNAKIAADELAFDQAWNEGMYYDNTKKLKNYPIVNAFK